MCSKLRIQPHPNTTYSLIKKATHLASARVIFRVLPKLLRIVTYCNRDLLARCPPIIFIIHRCHLIYARSHLTSQLPKSCASKDCYHFLVNYPAKPSACKTTKPMDFFPFVMAEEPVKLQQEARPEDKRFQ
jgi:hypothetical protein